MGIQVHIIGLVGVGMAGLDRGALSVEEIQQQCAAQWIPQPSPLMKREGKSAKIPLLQRDFCY
jgi:hypothetical protein